MSPAKLEAESHGACGDHAKYSVRETTSVAETVYAGDNVRGAKLVPTFHPAYLLRNPASKRDVWDDMKKVRSLLKEKS